MKVLIVRKAGTLERHECEDEALPMLFRNLEMVVEAHNRDFPNDRWLFGEGDGSPAGKDDIVVVYEQPRSKTAEEILHDEALSGHLEQSAQDVPNLS